MKNAEEIKEKDANKDGRRELKKNCNMLLWLCRGFSGMSFEHGNETWSNKQYGEIFDSISHGDFDFTQRTSLKGCLTVHLPREIK